MVTLLFLFFVWSHALWIPCSDTDNCKSVDNVDELADRVFRLGKVNYNKVFNIPKVIHQIWIGGRSPLPYMTAWKTDYIHLCPGWEYRLWNESSGSRLRFLSQTTYGRETTLNGKSDLLRVAILREHGGVYIDADSMWLGKKCLDNFTLVASTTGFFAALEPTPRSLQRRLPCLGHPAPGVMGAIRNHAILREMARIQERNVQLKAGMPAWMTVGPLALAEAHKIIGNGPRSSVCMNNLTGDIPSSLPLSIIYHWKYFYPVSWHDILGTKIDVRMLSDAIMLQYGYTTNSMTSRRPPIQHKVVKTVPKLGNVTPSLSGRLIQRGGIKAFVKFRARQ